MMDTIVTDGLISFKELEKKIFDYACGLAREITKTVLENYDKKLAGERDKSAYRHKGFKTTTIKTLYGEVEYSRRVYRVENEEERENGGKVYVFLLDKAMRMDKIGLISTNLAERIAMAVTESPYRAAADTISRTCGQTISAQGAWNLMQRLGERISDEEDHFVRQMDADQSEGEKSIGVLFEEMDGVWLHMQDEHHKKAKSQEMKVFTMYEGWDAAKEKAGRSTLVNKRMLAGMEGSTDFHAKREALIRNTYDGDEIGQRILNGDGGGWIRDTYDPDTIFQLDRFHIQQAIMRKISDREAQKDIRQLFEEEKMDEMLSYIATYADSVESPDETDKRSRKARELLEYLENNRDGLPAYDHRGIEIPKPADGILYKHMGVQENQNCTVITLRMKHRRMRWSTGGANNLAKALYRRENGELADTIDRYTDGLVFTVQMQEIVESLSAAKAPKHDGKGNVYADLMNCHLPLSDAARTASRKAFLNAFCN